MSSVPADDPLVGRLVDNRYEVLELIAHGGMASVYLATDTRLDRDVALKVLRPHLAADPDFVARFRREARSAARLSHPNVVAVLDHAESDGAPFLVMEYVPGQTLREILDAEGALSPRAATDLVLPVLDALGAAHRAGLIHRDVKPENVIVREDGVVKVADFGLARTVSSSTATAATGILLGTAAYLSPEQVERGIADARSDVYAAGLVLFEMLTGRKAMPGEDAIHVAYSHVHRGVPRASEVSDGVPEVLEEVVAAATAKDPDERPADGAAMAALVRSARRELTPEELDARPTAASAPQAVQATAQLPVRRAAHTRTTDTLPRGAAAPPPPARHRRRLWPWVAVVVSAVLAAGTAWYVLLGPGSVTTVPVVAGQPLDTARSALTAQDLRSDVEEVFSETVRAGTVVDSDPAAGTSIPRSRTVHLRVSKGQERYAVPTLVGSALDAARAALTDARLTVGTVRQVYDEQAPAGTVMSSDPKVGARLRKGTAVDLVVSRGRQPLTLSDWTGKPAAQAKAAMESVGLVVDDSARENSDTVPEGAVIRQSPGPGTLHKGDKVTLVVSKGPVLVAVPEVQGRQRDEAEAILRAAGFRVKVEEAFGGFFQTVRRSDPAAGTMLPKGSTVTILVV